MTIAHKTKSKVPKVFKKYGPELTITDSNNNIIASYGLVSFVGEPAEMHHIKHVRKTLAKKILVPMISTWKR
jgi:hypothetical protein